MRTLSFLFVFLFVACDPYYHIAYCVRNKTPDTVYIKYKNYPDSVSVVNPDAMLVLKSESGIGFAKGKYKSGEFQKWFSDHSVMIRKGEDNSMKKVSETKWKYEGHRIEGNAVLYIKK